MPFVSQSLEFPGLAFGLRGDSPANLNWRGYCRTMNVHHLELFYFAAKFGGITAAVRQMPYGIQQPAMSGQLLQLEEDLACKLFNRRPFALTEAGEVLYEFIAPFFGGLDDIEARLRGEAGRRLRIAASMPVLRDFLPALLRALEARLGHPLKFSLRESNQRVAEELIARQETDLAIVEMGGKAAPGLRCQELAALTPVLLVPETHPVRQAKTLLDQESPSETLIAFAPTETLTKEFQANCRKRGCYWEPGIEASSLELIYTYVRQGFGIGLGVHIPGLPVPEGIRQLLLKDFTPLCIAAIWQGAPTALVQAFLEIAGAQAESLGLKKQ